MQQSCINVRSGALCDIIDSIKGFPTLRGNEHMADDELNRLRETNERLAEENRELREKSHEFSTGLRLSGYLGVCGFLFLLHALA
jgi:hypothetical protein